MCGSQRMQGPMSHGSTAPNVPTIRGLLFFMPDRSAGPVSWTCCDNNADEVSPVQFGSKRGQHRGNTGRTERGRFGSRLTFLGPFDFSVRPWDRASEPEFVIPRTRFDQTQLAMRE